MNKKKTLLLVEDEIILAMSEKLELEKYGYAVKTVNTGEKAVEAVSTMLEIDLVLMDINLGDGIDGTEAAVIILKEHDIPIVFVSSHSEREVVEKTEKITSYGYVVKNSSITVLDASIKMAFKLFEASKKTQSINKKLEAAFDAFPDLVFEVGLSGTLFDIHASNPSLLYPALDEMRGKTVNEILPPEAAYTIMSAIKEANENGISYGKEYELSVNAGLRWFELSISRISVDFPEPNFICLAHDITDRKKIENELIRAKEYAEKSELQLQGILDNMVDAFFQADLNGNFTFVNQTALSMYRYISLEEIIGMPASNLYAIKEERDELIEELKKSGKKIGWTGKALRKDGTTFWVSMNVQVIRDKDGKIIGTQGVAHDITERKMAEIALKQSEEKYRNLHESIRDGVVFTDMKGHITGSNSEFQNMLGYTDAELKSLSVSNITPKKWLGIERDVISEQLLEKGYTDPYEKEYQRKDGSICTVEISVFTIKDENNIPKSLWAIVRDITDRKKVDEKLRESEARFRSYFEMPLHGYAITSPEKGWLFINDRLCSMLGYSREEMLKKTWLEMTYSDDIAEDVDKYNHMVSGEIDQYSMHKRYIRKDGSIIWASIAVGCVRSLDGIVDHVVAIIEDITDQKRAEKYIKTLLAEKELLLKEVHHRIKNNMNIVSSLLSLQAQTIKEPSAVSALQEAKSKVQSMSILYDKLYRSVDYTELSIKGYLTSLVEEVIANFPNNQNVKVEKVIEDFMLDAKRLQPLGIIINELLTNIMKDAFLDHKVGHITVTSSKVNGHVTISVKDDGVGMPETVTFENSTGFGLQLVQGLTQQLNGTIRIERENGTKVVLEFDV